MERIVVIFGRQSISANNTDPADVTDAMRATGASLYPTVCDTDPRLRVAANSALDTLATHNGPALVFAVANARDANTQKPMQLYGGSNDLADMMSRLARQSRNRQAPLDVFVLTADDPAFIHQHIHQLPAGSTAVAIRTFPDSAQNDNFWQMLKRPGLYKDVPLTARSLLLHMLMGGKETQGLPEIAVSGKPRTSLSEMWKEMVRQNGMSTKAAQELSLIANHMNKDFALSFTMTRDVIAKNIVGAYPIGAAFYACAAASTWEHFYGPPVTSPASAPAASATTTTRQPVRKPAQPSTSTASAATAQATHKRPRPTNSQIGGLYKPGVPMHKQHPAVVKRLLRRN